MASALVFILFQAWHWGIWKPLTIHGVDYGKHWEAARALLEGESTYIGGDLWLGFNYPQATAFMFLWLGLFTFETAERIWKVFLLLSIVGCWLLGWRYYAPGAAVEEGLTPTARALRAAGRARWGWLTAFATAAFMPAISAIYIGNIDPWNAVLAVAMVAALLRGRERLGGVVWALLTLVKMLPVALIVPVLAWGRRRLTWGFLGVMAVYFVLLVVTGRLAYEWFFVHEMMPMVPRRWRWISITPVRGLLDLFGRADVWENPYGFMAATRVQLVLFAPLYVGLNIWLRRRRVSFLAGLEAAIVAYPLLTPLLEYHHFVWIMPALFLQMRRWAEGRLTPGITAGLLAGWVTLQLGFIFTFQLVYLGDWTHYVALAGYLVVLAFTLIDVSRRRGEGAEPGAERMA